MEAIACRHVYKCAYASRLYLALKPKYDATSVPVLPSPITVEQPRLQVSRPVAKSVYLTYCSTVCFHCGKRNIDIIEKLNASILRFVFNDFNNSYEKLSQDINQPNLRARRINDMLILVFLTLNNAAPTYITRQTQVSYPSCKYNKITHLNIMLVFYGIYCRIISVCLLLLVPSKLHLKLFNSIMNAVLFVTNVRF